MEHIRDLYTDSAHLLSAMFSWEATVKSFLFLSTCPVKSFYISMLFC